MSRRRVRSNFLCMLMFDGFISPRARARATESTNSKAPNAAILQVLGDEEDENSAVMTTAAAAAGTDGSNTPVV